jgi:hypothetical protein
VLGSVADARDEQHAQGLESHLDRAPAAMFSPRAQQIDQVDICLAAKTDAARARQRGIEGHMVSPVGIVIEPVC